MPDHGFDRSKQRFEAHYFYTPEKGYAAISVPVGKIVIEVMKGFENHLERRMIEAPAGEETNVEIQLTPMDWRKVTNGHWVSGDLHVHMNYGGEYKNDPSHLQDQAEGEGLAVVNNLVVNKEQRFPDIAYAVPQLNSISGSEVTVINGQEFHTSYWGHRGLLDMRRNILLPGYAGYPNTAAASLCPMDADVYDMAHAQGGLW